jgi:hypothetical protein
MTTGNRFSFARRFIARAGEVTSQSTASNWCISVSAFSHLFVHPRTMYHYHSAPIILGVSRHLFSRGVTIWQKGFKTWEVAWWIGSGQMEGLASMGGIRGPPVLDFWGFILPHTTRLRRLAGSFNTCCNCTAQAEQQAQPSWLWDKLYLFATWFCGGQGPRAVVGEDACCLGGGAFFASSIQYRLSLSA